MLLWLLALNFSIIYTPSYKEGQCITRNSDSSKPIKFLIVELNDNLEVSHSRKIAGYVLVPYDYRLLNYDLHSTVGLAYGREVSFKQIECPKEIRMFK